MVTAPLAWIMLTTPIKLGSAALAVEFTADDLLDIDYLVDFNAIMLRLAGDHVVIPREHILRWRFFTRESLDTNINPDDINVVVHKSILEETEN